MNQQHIHCSVNNCHYWAQGNKCEANEIVVVSDTFGAQQPDQVDASMAKQFPPTPVQTCMESCCKTFVSQNSDKIRVDKVTKMQ